MTPAIRTTASRAGALLAFALAATVVGACGGSTAVTLPDTTGAAPAAPAGDTPEPEKAAPAGDPTGEGVCSIVDASLAAEALGGATVDAGTARHNTVFGGDGCVFRATASGDWVSIWVSTDLTRDDWEATAEKTGATSGDVIDGLGDAAYRSVGRTSGLRLDAFDGGLAVGVMVSQRAIDAERATPPAMEIVRSVLAQLS